MDEKKKVFDKIIEEVSDFAKDRNDKGLLNYITLLCFLEHCDASDIKLKGENKFIPPHLNSVMYKATISPSKFSGWLKRQLYSFFDNDLKAFYSFTLKVEKEDVLSLENLLRIKDYEERKFLYPDKNKALGEIAWRLEDRLEKEYWESSNDMTLTERYSLIADLLVRMGLLEENDDTDNEKQHHIAKYLKSYYNSVDKNSHITYWKEMGEKPINKK